MNDLQQSLENLFSEAGHAHHEAFAHVNGADDEWALWYADYVQVKMSELLNREFTREALAATLTQLDSDYRAQPCDESWQEFYANHFLEG